MCRTINAQKNYTPSHQNLYSWYFQCRHSGLLFPHRQEIDCVSVDYVEVRVYLLTKPALPSASSAHETQPSTHNTQAIPGLHRSSVYPFSR